MSLFDGQPLEDARWPGGGPAAPASVDWTPTRAAGLARLRAFMPSAGRAYARDRNMDRGPHDRSNISCLSPWLRRRLITEEEVLAATVGAHGFQASEKFVQEVFWRGYWKGWLEMRPEVLIRFDAERRALAPRWHKDRALALAKAGATGIECYDAWVGELVETGYLHNHARMWFASIWIFTLGLPWQLGADFFYKHLLDADPASNTLSWRWVAGLHTRGKHYLARASNIAQNTQGRFDPAGALNERALPLVEDGPPPLVRALPHGGRAGAGKVAVLLSEEDLHPESWDLDLDALGVAALASPVVGDPDSAAARFGRGAQDDGLARADGVIGRAAGVLSEDAVVAWAKALGARELLTGYAPAGLIGWSLDRLETRLRAEGIGLVRHLRPYDARLWPHASAGFFKVKARIPDLVAGLSESGRA